MIHTQTFNVKVKVAKQPKIETSGLLWGGNLAMFCAMLGTPYMPKIKNGILFFEDISESPYRIERMLLQVKQAGILDKQRAVVMGQFTGYKLSEADNGYNFDEVVSYMRKQTKVPIITGLPFGHVNDKVTLPFGSKVKLKSTSSGFSLT